LICIAVAMYYIINNLIFTTVTAVAQWLRRCATNWKVAGSILPPVIGILYIVDVRDTADK